MERNPYIGPRPFERGDNFKLFGRDREIRELQTLIGAEREVLIYGRSGAGKTSLINAGLIPELEALRYQVLPVLRVGADLPSGIAPSQVDNIFVYNALLHLASGLASPLPGAAADAARRGVLPGMTGLSPVDTRALLSERLPSMLQSRFSKATGELRPLILIFDQAEELFTTHSDRWQDVRGFFDQVRSALEQIPRLGVIFCFSEEYLAALDPYLGHFRTRLRARYRVDLLRPETALEVVTQPALEAGVSFTPEAAACLVENLRRVPHTSQQTGPRQLVLGPLVDPLNLQVTCSQLWRALPEGAPGGAPSGVTQISARDVPTGLGDSAINDYYELGLREASHAASITDREVRRWVTRQLIGSGNLRQQVQQGVQTTAGLPNDAVQVLANLNLIRFETRAGARWFELAHDRLVATIQASNRAWERSRLTPLRATARRWKESGEASLLYRGRTLAELGDLVSAAQERKSNLYDLEPAEIEFYQASLKAEKAAARRVRWMWGGVALGLLVMLVLAFLAIQGRSSAALAEQSETVALDNQFAAQQQAATAVAYANQAGDQYATAVAAISGERQNTSLARANQDAALSGTVLGREQPQLSLLLGAQSIRLAQANGAARSIAGEQALRDALSQVSGMPLQGHTQSITGLAASPVTAQAPNGHWLATAGDDGQVFLWDLTQPNPGDKPLLLSGHAGWVSAAVFSPDAHWLATAGRDGVIRVWDMTAADPSQAVLTLEGHQGSVEPLVFSPDGRWLISGGADKTVRLWRVDTFAAAPQSQTLSGHEEAVTRLAVSDDSAWLASASRDGVIYLWNLSANDPGSKGQKLSLPGPVAALAFSPNARWLAAAGDAPTVSLWEVGPAVSANPLVLGRHNGLVTALSFSPDGCWLASGGADQKVRLWYMDPQKDRLGQVFYTLTGHTGEVDALAFPALNPGSGSTWLASGSADHTVRLWDLSPVQVQGQNCATVSGDALPDSRTTDLPVTLLRGLDGKVNRLLFLAANQWLAGAGADGSARIWDTAFIAASDEPAWYDTSSTGRLFADALSPDGKWVFAAADAGVFAWPVDQPRAKPLHLGCEAKGAFSAASAFPGASGLMAAGCMDGPVLLWDARALDASGKVMPTQLSGLTSMVSALALRADGQWLAAGDLKGRLLVWHLADGVPQGSPLLLMDDAKTVRALAFAPDGRWLASADSLGRVRLWDFSVDNPVLLAEFKPSESPVNTLAVSADGTWLAAGGQDSKVHLWKMSAFTPGQALPAFHLDGFYSWVQSLAFSPNGNWLAAGGVDASLRQWDLTKLASLDPAQAPTPAADTVSVVMRDHDDQIFAVRYSPDSRWLISAGADSTLRQWDPTQPDQTPVRFSGHSHSIRTLVFTLDSQSVISPSEDGTLRRWALSTEALINAACRETRRTFRPEEIHRYLDDIAPLELCK